MTRSPGRAQPFPGGGPDKLLGDARRFEKTTFFNNS